MIGVGEVLNAGVQLQLHVIGEPDVVGQFRVEREEGRCVDSFGPYFGSVFERVLGMSDEHSARVVARKRGREVLEWRERGREVAVGRGRTHEFLHLGSVFVPLRLFVIVTLLQRHSGLKLEP